MKSLLKKSSIMVGIASMLVITVGVAPVARADVITPPTLPSFNEVFGNVPNFVPEEWVGVDASAAAASGASFTGAAAAGIMGAIAVGASAVPVAISCVDPTAHCYQGDNILGSAYGHTYPFADVMRNWEIDHPDQSKVTFVTDQQVAAQAGQGIQYDKSVGFVSPSVSDPNSLDASWYHVYSPASEDILTTINLVASFLSPYPPNNPSVQHNWGFWYKFQCFSYQSPTSTSRTLFDGSWQYQQVTDTTDYSPDKHWVYPNPNTSCAAGEDVNHNDPKGYKMQVRGITTTDVAPAGQSDPTTLTNGAGTSYPNAGANVRGGNQVAWNVAGMYPTAPENTHYTFTQNCMDGNGNASPISTVIQGNSDSLNVKSCLQAGLKPATSATLTYDDGHNPTQTVGTLKAAPLSDNPGCDVTNGGTPCTLSVWLQGAQCVTGSATCANWSEIARSRPDQVQCKLGAVVVALSACNSLERAYGTRPAQLNAANTDGDPTTGGPDYYVDPSGKQIPRPSNGIDTGGFPATGSQSDPSNCLSKLWSFQPLDFVMNPIGCSLQAMFIPSPSTFTNAQTQLQTKIQNKGIQKFTDAMSTLITGIGGAAGTGSAGGCQGPPLPFDMVFGPPAPSPGHFEVHNVYHPLDACQEPVRTIATVTNALISFTVGVAGGLAFIRVLGKAFGFEFSMGVKE